jgi:uncharacterized protein YeaO (DUF488 family)
MSQVPTTTPESDALSKDLKKRGFSFVGSTVIYAHMQAAGLVNDHTTDCFRYPSNSPSHRITRMPSNPQASRSPALKIKRVYDDPSPDDGFRILIDLLWPRGLSKARAKVDCWQKDLAPSTALRNWFKHDPTCWKEFQSRYTKELQLESELVENVWKRAKQGPVTILFGAKAEKYNNAVALKAYICKRYRKG